jgi:23S rRNA (pseudouridine1915-N3)-methyltransferase
VLGVTVLAVGGVKERYFAEACGEYLKRLGAFCKPGVEEIAEYRLGKNPSAAEIAAGLACEGKAILERLNRLPRAAFSFALVVDGGEAPTSQGLAERLDKAAHSSPHLAFIVGGSHGLSPEVKSACGALISMSSMTFPHTLARVMLLEQLYRAFSINAGLKYHK